MGHQGELMSCFINVCLVSNSCVVVRIWADVLAMPAEPHKTHHSPWQRHSKCLMENVLIIFCNDQLKTQWTLTLNKVSDQGGMQPQMYYHMEGWPYSITTIPELVETSPRLCNMT